MGCALTANADHAAKRLARLAAVQALYEGAFEQEPLEGIIGRYIEQDFALLREEFDGGASPDVPLFRAIVQGAATQLENLDTMISGAASGKVSGERFEKLLRAILRAGAHELHQHGNIPVGIIINDYVDVARVFFDGKEPGMVNGILDKLAGKLRVNSL